MDNKIKWSVDQIHSEIAFKIRHLMIAHVKGRFKKFEGSIYTTGLDLNSVEIDLWIDPSSIDTGNSDRDEHLKGSDFFDVELHKQISFVSSTMELKGGDDEYELWGDLTIKGITKRIMLHVEFGGIATDAYGRQKSGFVVTGKINRSDWGLIWNSSVESGGLLVGDEIKISCDLELINMGAVTGIMILE